MHISKDLEANAGYISFARNSTERVKVAQTLPVTDGDGELTAALDFNEAGELVGIELMDAARQMAHLDVS